MTREWVLRREPSRDGATIGSLFVEGRWFCWTLEDVVREVPGVPVSQWKQYGLTAIPRGRYRLIVTMSKRFGRGTPLLVNVPGYDGIRIHAGNTEADTIGCILVGQDRTVNTVLKSRPVEKAITSLVMDAAHRGDTVFLTVE
jgi:hypothetical protein